MTRPCQPVACGRAAATLRLFTSWCRFEQRINLGSKVQELSYQVH